MVSGQISSFSECFNIFFIWIAYCIYLNCKICSYSLDLDLGMFLKAATGSGSVRNPNFRTIQDTLPFSRRLLLLTFFVFAINKSTIDPQPARNTLHIKVFTAADIINNHLHFYNDTVPYKTVLYEYHLCKIYTFALHNKWTQLWHGGKLLLWPISLWTFNKSNLLLLATFFCSKLLCDFLNITVLLFLCTGFRADDKLQINLMCYTIVKIIFNRAYFCIK